MGLGDAFRDLRRKIEEELARTRRWQDIAEQARDQTQRARDDGFVGVLDLHEQKDHGFDAPVPRWERGPLDLPRAASVRVRLVFEAPGAEPREEGPNDAPP